MRPSRYADHGPHGPADSSAVVVIPAYKTGMDPSERVALERCRDVLKRYDRVLVVPEKMDTQAYLRIDPQLRTERFPSRHFESIVGYSDLCRDSDFYARFGAYAFMLLYQLDAYVFDDQLSSWCLAGYDYVGGPWPNYEFQRLSRKAWVRSPLLRPFLRRVGNGGFSLRRVDTFERASVALRRYTPFFRDIPEDVFWCNIAPYLYPFRIRIAPFRLALRFAFDVDPATCSRLVGGALPFGCHGWSRAYHGFWGDRIAAISLASQARTPTTLDNNRK